MKSSADIPTPAPPLLRGIFGPLTLKIRGTHPPSFKNRKRIAGNRLITRPDIKARMDQLARDFESQLSSAYQTAVAATLTGFSPHYWMHCVMPADDSLNDIPTGGWTTVLVPKGEEGVDITITPL